MADYIDRDELLNKFKNTREAIDFVAEDKNVNKDYIRGQIMRLENCITEVNCMPVIEQKHGHWELKRRIADVNWWSCSKCGRITDLGMGLKTPPYCQWCGAKMDEVTEDGIQAILQG